MMPSGFFFLSLLSERIFTTAGSVCELGIRLAIGAEPRGVVALVLSKGVVLTACGIAIGSMASAWAMRALSTYLFGISPLDVPTYAAVALLLVITSIAAVIYPARRASRIDPVECLRAE